MLATKIITAIKAIIVRTLKICFNNQIMTDTIIIIGKTVNASLVQLSFNSYDNEARKEYVDEGVWLNLKTGKIYKTLNYRPYKATK